MICMALIFICLIGYWKSESLFMVTIFAAIVGCLIYVPQFLASVPTMEIVPSFAVGSAVGFTRFYELYLRCVSGHQPVWYYGRSYWLAWRILSSWLRYYLLHHFSAGYHIVVQLNLNVTEPHI